jgi:hypothetical protein
MAIKVTFLTVVTRIETVERRYPGGMEAYTKDNRIEKPYRDRNITGVLFMSTGEAEEFIEKLVKLGFSYDEIALVDQFFGSFDPCDWLETDISSYLDTSRKDSTCWLKKTDEKK